MFCLLYVIPTCSLLWYSSLSWFRLIDKTISPSPFPTASPTSPPSHPPPSPSFPFPNYPSNFFSFPSSPLTLLPLSLLPLQLLLSSFPHALSPSSSATRKKRQKLFRTSLGQVQEEAALPFWNFFLSPPPLGISRWCLLTLLLSLSLPWSLLSDSSPV